MTQQSFLLEQPQHHKGLRREGGVKTGGFPLGGLKSQAQGPQQGSSRASRAKVEALDKGARRPQHPRFRSSRARHEALKSKAQKSLVKLGKTKIIWLFVHLLDKFLPLELKSELFLARLTEIFVPLQKNCNHNRIQPCSITAPTIRPPWPTFTRPS